MTQCASIQSAATDNVGKSMIQSSPGGIGVEALRDLRPPSGADQQHVAEQRGLASLKVNSGTRSVRSVPPASRQSSSARQRAMSTTSGPIVPRLVAIRAASAIGISSSTSSCIGLVMPPHRACEAATCAADHGWRKPGHRGGLAAGISGRQAVHRLGDARVDVHLRAPHRLDVQPQLGGLAANLAGQRAVRGVGCSGSSARTSPPDRTSRNAATPRRPASPPQPRPHRQLACGRDVDLLWPPREVVIGRQAVRGSRRQVSRSRDRRSAAGFGAGPRVPMTPDGTARIAGACAQCITAPIFTRMHTC